MHGISSIKTQKGSGTNSSPKLGSGSRGNSSTPGEISPAREIETGTPIASVRAAVSLFGEANSPSNRQLLKKNKSSIDEVFCFTLCLAYAHGHMLSTKFCTFSSFLLV